jgi:transcriptional regulator with XRE-family HTH domain
MARSTYLPANRVLADLLRQIRLDADLRQSDVAEALKRSQSWVSDYEAGQRRLDLIELRQVCEACGVSLTDFVGRFEKSATPSRGRSRKGA